MNCISNKRHKPSRKWLILIAIALTYLPVTIDTTILYVAIPKIGVSLKATNAELLWIIDIYSLVMASIVLPMGILSDKIGFKRLLLLGSVLFGGSSFLSATSNNVLRLIIGRIILAVGGAMIVPSTLSVIRNTFLEKKQRFVVLGIWVAIGSFGTAFGPLIGGALLKKFYWGSIFLINIPAMFISVILTTKFIPKQEKTSDKPLSIKQSILFISSILILVYCIKNLFEHLQNIWCFLILLSIGSFLLLAFIRIQTKTSNPMIDIHLFKNRIILSGILISTVSMAVLAGFELLTSQELQFIYNETPLEVGFFMLPIMLASIFSTFFANMLLCFFGLRVVLVTSILTSSLGLFALSITDFNLQATESLALMSLVGFSAANALLNSTNAMMSLVEKQNAAALGAIETMAYEIGAALGIALFGSLLNSSYQRSVLLSFGSEKSYTFLSIEKTIKVAQRVTSTKLSKDLINSAKTAFISAHHTVLFTSGLVLLLLSAVVWKKLSLPFSSYSERNT